MRITVLSDSHGRPDVVQSILEQREDSRHVFFLGDGIRDIEPLAEKFPDKRFYLVSGNCDAFSLAPSSGIEVVGGVRVFYTHGHTLDVRYGVERLLSHARAAACPLALFGHTHVPQIVYEDGVTLVNPGSCARPRGGGATYAMIDLTEKGVMPLIVEL
ncbi:MAG: YfcE family phosphodiesterase [Clostridia bacterium]|nr:YfcE family phosphodiesterase [Clostridia bacterium]